MTIQTFNSAGEWGYSDQILGGGDDEDINADRLEADAGFQIFDQLGEHHASSIEILTRTKAGVQEYLVNLNTSNWWRAIFCPDLGACLLLLQRLEPWLRMAMGTVLYDFAKEFHELLVEYGIDGPLRESLRRRSAIEDRRRAQARAIKEARLAKEAKP